MTYKQYCKERDEYYSKLCPTDDDFKKYTRAHFEWCDHAIKNSMKPIDMRKVIMV